MCAHTCTRILVCAGESERWRSICGIHENNEVPGDGAEGRSGLLCSVCTLVCIQTCMRAHVRVHRVPVHAQVYMYAVCARCVCNVHACVSLRARVCACANVRFCVLACMHVFLHVCVLVCACACVLVRAYARARVCGRSRVCVRVCTS